MSILERTPSAKSWKWFTVRPRFNYRMTRKMEGIAKMKWKLCHFRSLSASNQFLAAKYATHFWHRTKTQSNAASAKILWFVKSAQTICMQKWGKMTKTTHLYARFATIQIPSRSKCHLNWHSSSGDSGSNARAATATRTKNVTLIGSSYVAMPDCTRASGTATSGTCILSAAGNPGNS